MKNKFLVIVGCVALLGCISLNIRNVFDDYGIRNISLVNAVWAQSGCDPGDDGSGGSGWGGECYSETVDHDWVWTYCECHACIPCIYGWCCCNCGPANQIGWTTYTSKCIMPNDPSPSACEQGTYKITYGYTCCLRDVFKDDVSSTPKIVLCAGGIQQ